MSTGRTRLPRRTAAHRWPELSLTDVYMSGDLAHLEGEYEVTDKGKVTKGHYVQLWMRDGPAWRIHREMWWH